MSESGISLHARLPLAWAATHAFPQPLLAEWMHGNLVCLQALAALESHEKEIDASATGEHAAGRVEAKVDLLLQLVGELMRKQQPSLPSVEPSEVTASPGVIAPLAMKAAMLSVVPART